MQITNNYLISKLYFQNAQKKQKKAKNDVGFGKVIGQKDNLFNVIGMKRTAIVDKISDDAGPSKSNKGSKKDKDDDFDF